MAASKAQRAATAERRGKAIAMRLAGMDFETIAKRLGYAGRGAACQDISRALEMNIATQVRTADVLREQELLRLDRLQAGAWQAAAGGDPRAIDSVLRIIDRRIKLLGLDAPVRHEVVSLDAIDAEIRTLTEQLGRGAAAEAEGAEAASG